MTISINCDGKSCGNTAVKGRPRPGWVVVVIYPLYEDDETPERRLHLCRRCAKFMGATFK